MAILGTRGSGSFAAHERPENWRQGILLLFPNGTAPLTALLSKLAEEPTDDARFHWYEKGLPVQRAMITGAKATDPPTAGDDIATNQTADAFLLVKPDGAAAVDATIFKPGHLIYNETTDEVMLVLSVDASTNQTIKVKRDVGDKFATNPAITGDATTGDRIIIVGTGFPEGAPLGDSIAYSPITHFNFTQIFRTPLKLTRTARRTKLRTDKSGPYMEAQREALQLHATEMEWAFWLNERSEITSGAGTNAALSGTSTGMPLRTTRGVLNWLPTINTTTTASLHWDVGTAFSGVLTEDTFDKWLEELFRFGGDKFVMAGSTAVNVLNQLAKNKLTIEAVPTDETYGMKFTRYITPFGDLMVKQHPLFSNNPTFRKDIWAVDPARLKYRYIDDTTFLQNRQNPGDDLSADEFLTEAGLELQFSGATPDSSGGLAAIAGPGAHGRLKGIASYGG